MGVVNVYLLRHGETVFSHEDRFCGQIDAPLTSEGHAMAARFAAAFGDLDWRAIVTSTRVRAIDTAEPLASLTGLASEIDPRLDEMGYGDWQGLSKREAAARNGDYFAQWVDDPSIGPPGGEAPRDVAVRGRAALDELRARHDGGNVLVVSHKSLLRLLICQLFNIELRHYRLGWPVGAVTQLELGASGPIVRRFADVTHLTTPDDEAVWRLPPLTAASV